MLNEEEEIRHFFVPKIEIYVYLKCSNLKTEEIEEIRQHYGHWSMVYSDWRRIKICSVNFIYFSMGFEKKN